jgi:thiol-disulfide isomerase/thioredoxin
VKSTLRLLVLLAVGVAAGEVMIPRYNLAVGTRLFYSSSGESKYARGARGQTRLTEVWVVGRNPDLSWRLVLHRTSRPYRIDSTGARTDGEPQVEWARCELAPDGVASGVGTTGSLGPSAVLPLLTAGGGPDTLREEYDRESGERTRYTTLGLTEPYGSVMIRAEYLTPLDSVYLTSSNATFYFDPKRGLVTHKDAETEQRWGPFAGKSEATTTLDSVVPLDTAKARRLDADLAVYLGADSVYQALLDRASENAAARPGLLDSAQAVMDSGRARVRDSTVQTLFDDEVGTLEEIALQMKEDDAWRDSLVGKPAPAWTWPGLDGRKHSLKEYRGKVVILDFWYRGCPWCIRAMPRLNDLARKYAGRPVAVVGMNTDRDSSDARFVVEKLRLGYTNLLARGEDKAYRVRGFPTLFVVDAKGVINDIRVGYSPDLEAKLTATVDRLLGAK